MTPEQPSLPLPFHWISDGSLSRVLIDADEGALRHQTKVWQSTAIEWQVTGFLWLGHPSNADRWHSISLPKTFLTEERAKAFAESEAWQWFLLGAKMAHCESACIRIGERPKQNSR